MKPGGLFSIKSTSKGRGLIATQTIEEGDLILSEYPMYLSQYPQNKLHFPACPTCLAPIVHVNKYLYKMLEIETEYEQCLEVEACKNCGLQYCSKSHLDADVIHPAFCNNTAFISLIEWWIQIHSLPEWSTPELPLRIVFDLSLKSDNLYTAFEDSLISNLLHKLDNKSFEDDVLNNITSNNFIEYYELCELAFHQGTTKLLGHPVALPIDLFKSIVLACALNGQGCGSSPLDALRIMTDFEDDVLEEIAETLQDEYSEFTHCEATAVYPTHAMINHSCLPNAICQFTNLNELDLQDSKIEIVALKEIQKGQEIYISYNNSNEMANYNFEMYRFICECPECKK